MRSLLLATRASTACALLALAAGCSGGGSSPANAPGPIATTQAPTVPSSFGKSNASITVRVPALASAKRASRGRKPLYVSPATQGLIAAFTANNATTYQGFTLTPNTSATTSSPATCGAPTNGSYSCTLYFVLPPGSFTGTLTTYDSAQSGTSGAPVPASNVASAVALSSDTEPVTIVANTANNFTFTLHAIVEAFQSTPQYIGVPAAPASAPPTLSTTFSALDGDNYLVDSVDPDSTTTFDSGAQASGPFSQISFAVSEVDGNTCNASPCTTLASSAPAAVTDTATEGVSFSYTGQGASGDGTANNPPYYGLIALADTTGYDGATSPASPAGGPYAATAFVVPFFGFISTTAATTGSPTISDATDVSFTSSGDSVTLDAIQYHLPDSSAGYTATPSTTCTASPGGGTIASITASSALAYGEAFTLSAGNGSGNCTVTLSDGVAADDVTINVTSTAAGGATITVPAPCATLAPDARKRSLATLCGSFSNPNIVQMASGNVPSENQNFGITSIGSNDTLLCLYTFTPGAYYESDETLEFDQGYRNAGDAYGNNLTVAFANAVDSASPGTALELNNEGQYGPSSWWCAEIANTSSQAIYNASQNSYGAVGNTPPSITPTSPQDIVLASSSSNTTTDYTVPSGWQRLFSYDGPSSLDVEAYKGAIGAVPQPISFSFVGGNNNGQQESSLVDVPITSSGMQAAHRRDAIVRSVIGKRTPQ